MPRTYIISLRTLYNNLGDLAINALLISRLSKGGCVHCIATGVPQWYVDEIMAATVRGDYPISIIRSIKGTLITFIKILFSTSRLIVFMSPGAIPHTNSKQRLVLLAASLTLSKLQFAQVGASYARPDPSTMRLLRSITRGSHYLSVRDSGSQLKLAQHGVSVPLVPDLAFDMGRKPSQEKRFLVLNFRSSEEESAERLALRIKPIILYGNALGLEPVIFWQVSEDEKLSYELSAILGVPIFRNTRAPRPTLDVANDLYSRTCVICSNRLHGLIIGAANGAIPFGVLRSDERKISDCFELLGLGGFLSKDHQEDLTFLKNIGSIELETRLNTSFSSAREMLDMYFDKVRT